MRNLYLILHELEKKEVYFCLQSQGKNTCTNISVDDSKGRNHSFSHRDSKEVERFLMVMWGHLLSTPIASVFPAMPLPNSFPRM